MIRLYLISRPMPRIVLLLLAMFTSPVISQYPTSSPSPEPAAASFGPLLQCYHCINRLSTNDISKQEQNALKSALFARFNIPPSSEYCADGGSELLFRTVPKESCLGVNDTCVRIVSEGDASKKLVLRGCQSTLLKSQFELDTNYSCHNGATECITSCREPLCNTRRTRFSGAAQVLIVLALGLLV